jgi:hypothetical protein
MKNPINHGPHEEEIINEFVLVQKINNKVHPIRLQLEQH